MKESRTKQNHLQQQINKQWSRRDKQTDEYDDEALIAINRFFFSTILAGYDDENRIGLKNWCDDTFLQLLFFVHVIINDEIKTGHHKQTYTL